MTTDEGLTGSERVRKFQTMLHVKAKEEPKRRFHALCDKMWREDFLREARGQVRRNGGAAGVDGECFKHIEAYAVDRWLGELARDLREGTYAPRSGPAPARRAFKASAARSASGRYRKMGQCFGERWWDT